MRRAIFIKGILVGAGAGMIAGALLSPKSGKQNQEDIKNIFTDIKKRLTDDMSKMSTISREKYRKIVGGLLAGYKEAKKLTPKQVEEIYDILDESFTKIEKAAKRGSRG